MNNRTIRYGDYILLSSDTVISRKYYAAASLTEGNVKVISEKKDKTLNLSGVSLSLYPNFNEFVFRILPKLNYDTLKEFKTLKNRTTDTNYLTEDSKLMKKLTTKKYKK